MSHRLNVEPGDGPLSLTDVVGRGQHVTVDTSHATLAALRWQGSDDLIVLAHATGFHKEMWAPVIRALRRRNVAATIVAIDLRGHGDSPEPARPPSVWQHAHDVASVVEQLGRGTRHRIGVGHSLGGMAVSAAEICQPGTFDSLVLMDPALVPPSEQAEIDAPGGNPWAEGARRRRPAFTDRDEAYVSYASKSVFATWPDDVLQLYVDFGFEQRDGQWALKCTPEWEAATFSQPDFFEVWDRLVELNVPVRLITAEHSVTHPPDVADRLARHLDAVHIRLPGVTHFIPMEAPDAVAVEIAQQLDQLGCGD